MLILVFVFLVLDVVALPPIATKGVHWAKDGPNLLATLMGAMHPI
jgi:hypothetical protein